ncbi:hypothetical protein Rhal01_02565 [Rubritalea halochordaticola]|uniref:Uncharacterized protein n=1 Tax=Rubritalea halochordaticola TaxID=714537 RepID=A0ABP9V4W3_9BACT
MICSILHLLACCGMIASAIYGKMHAPDSATLYQHMIASTAVASCFGLVILYNYLMETFVEYYSGVLYTDGPMTPRRRALIILSLLFTLLPLLGLIPVIGGHAIPMIILGSLAALASLCSIIGYLRREKDEEDGDEEEC